MSNIKNLLDEIVNCSNCYGQGVIGYSNDEDYDLEWCDCNPYKMIIEDGEVIWEGDLASV